MNDMSAVIVPKSDQINADDLLSGPRTVTIERVEIKPGTEQPVSIHLSGEKKVYRPCKSMARVMVSQWGPDANTYIGRSLTLYNDPKVMWGGMAVGGIRISHMSHIDSQVTLALTATKGSKKAFTVLPLKMEAAQKANPERARVDKLIEKIKAAPDKATLDKTVLGQRAIEYRQWLTENYPDLEAEINAACKVMYAKFLPPPTDDDDDFPGEVTRDTAVDDIVDGMGGNLTMAG